MNLNVQITTLINLLLLVVALSLSNCGDTSNTVSVIVNDAKELDQAMLNAQPGSVIHLANGVWQDVQIKFYGLGTEEMPIVLSAETPGMVFIEGRSNLYLGGEYIRVEGLYFRNGYSPSQSVIRFKIGQDSIANHSIIANCVIESFNHPNQSTSDRWIELYGKHNQLVKSYIAGKTTNGATLMVYHDGNEHTDNYHQITYNYFGLRPKSPGSEGESIRFGSVETRLAPGRISVSNNYFEFCNGDEEIISDMTNYNSFSNNIFYQCEGGLVLRHGNYASVDGNIFIGGDQPDRYGGVAVLNTGHFITNNYFYKVGGENWKTPLAMMNGIRNSPINAYRHLTDVVVAFNTWVDCSSPWQIGVGQNKDSVDIIDRTKLRSEPPVRSTIANNLIFNTQAYESPMINHDDISGIRFEHNILDNNGNDFTAFEALRNHPVNMQQVNDWLFVPTEDNEILEEVFMGYKFESIQKDLFGNSRVGQNKVGAIVDSNSAQGFTIEKNIYGPDWFTPPVQSLP